MTMALTVGCGTAMAAVNVGLVSTPAGPIPVPSISMESDATGMPFFPKAITCGSPMVNLLTMDAMTAGCVGPGVASGTMMGPGRNLLPSTCVFYGGAPAVTIMSPTLQNLTNAPGMHMAPGQVVLMILS